MHPSICISTITPLVGQLTLPFLCWLQLRQDKSGLATVFDEIDFEYLNAKPASEAGTIWLHSFKDGVSQREMGFGPSKYQKLIGADANIASQWHTYTINWQPSSITWYLDNARLDQEVEGSTAGFKSPDMPMYLTFSIWTDERPAPSNFGGLFDPSGAPYTSQFRDVTRVICDINAGTLYNGPNWLYGVGSPAVEGRELLPSNTDIVDGSASSSIKVPTPAVDGGLTTGTSVFDFAAPNVSTQLLSAVNISSPSAVSGKDQTSSATSIRFWNSMCCVMMISLVAAVFV